MVSGLAFGEQEHDGPAMSGADGGEPGVQMRRLHPFFPLSHGILRVDDRRVISGIVHVIRHGLRWRDAPAGHGPHKALYNRFVRWSRLGVQGDPKSAITHPLPPK